MVRQVELFDANNKLVEAFNVSPSIISGSTVTLNPSSDLNLSSYYIQIPSSAFVDTAGNGFAGILNKTTLNFVTLDVNAPWLLSSIPSDNSAGIQLDKDIVLNFSEAVVAGSAKIRLFDSNDQIIETFNVSGLIISGSTITLNPTLDLKPDNSYYIKISSTALIDTAGNYYAGIDNKNRNKFYNSKEDTKRAFTEVKDDIGTDMKSNTTKADPKFCDGNYCSCNSCKRSCSIKNASVHHVLVVQTAHQATHVLLAEEGIALVLIALRRGVVAAIRLE